MRYNPKLDKFLNSSTLSASIFLLSGGYKTYRDYKTADTKYKKRYLIKDSVVLSGAAAGLLINRTAANKIRQSHIYEKAVTRISQKINEVKYNSSLKYTKSIVKELISGFASTASGILGALGADYALRVSGNSMSPRFEDGDIVLVKRQPTVEIGDLGIFVADGEGYFKRYNGQYLHSFNPAYQDILISNFSEFRCCGKVIGQLRRKRAAADT